jgi:hypothetical protein
VTFPSCVARRMIPALRPAEPTCGAHLAASSDRSVFDEERGIAACVQVKAATAGPAGRDDANRRIRAEKRWPDRKRRSPSVRPTCGRTWRAPPAAHLWRSMVHRDDAPGMTMRTSRWLGLLPADDEEERRNRVRQVPLWPRRAQQCFAGLRALRSIYATFLPIEHVPNAASQLTWREWFLQ